MLFMYYTGKVMMPPLACVYVCVYVCVHACVCACVCVHECVHVRCCSCRELTYVTGPVKMDQVDT